MPKIHVLDSDIANKIAAGEVVERPGSVVKELVENAMDAGAGNITVEIRNGGITYIRVTDDGSGMSREDARCCFLRHATSKIQNIADLYAIETLGFRGEALAAISAVSRIEMITSTGSGSGTRLILEGGKETECLETGAPRGTTMIVKDLFFNTPARMKFLKSDRSEGGFIAALMDRLAISNPQISFKLIQDGKTSLSTTGNGKLLDVIYAVLGKEVTKGMLQAESELQQVRVSGYVGQPEVTRPNRNFQLCYINGRLVRSQTVFAAIDQAYRNHLFHGRHAVCVISISLPFGLVDVNVHPSKMEVKFSNEKLIFEAVYYAIKGALNKQTLLQADQPVQKPSAPAQTTRLETREIRPEADRFGAVAILEKPQPLEPRPAAPIQENKQESEPALEEYFVSAPPKASFQFGAAHSMHETPAVAETPAQPVQQELLPTKEEVRYRYIGEVFKAYLLVESGDHLYLIDKHAAHERMIFDRLLREARENKRATQAMLVPERIQLSPDEMEFALEHQAELEDAGFELSAFGDKQILLRSRPVCLTGEAAAEAFEEILSSWMQGGQADRTERENVALKTVACKAAIKAGNINDSEELRALVCRLIEEDDIHQCPHGRPVLISYSRKSIEKAFKRI